MPGLVFFNWNYRAVYKQLSTQGENRNLRSCTSFCRNDLLKSSHLKCGLLFCRPFCISVSALSLSPACKKLRLRYSLSFVSVGSAPSESASGWKYLKTKLSLYWTSMFFLIFVSFIIQYNKINIYIVYDYIIDFLGIIKALPYWDVGKLYSQTMSFYLRLFYP